MVLRSVTSALKDSVSYLTLGIYQANLYMSSLGVPIKVKAPTDIALWVLETPQHKDRNMEEDKTC